MTYMDESSRRPPGRAKAAPDSRTAGEAAPGSTLGPLQAVDRPGHLDVRAGQAARGVRREREADAIPAVDEDVRVVVGRLGGLGDAVDERDGGGEVRKMPVAHDRVALADPVGPRERVTDLVVAEQCHAVPRADRIP